MQAADEANDENRADDCHEQCTDEPADQGSTSLMSVTVTCG